MTQYDNELQGVLFKNNDKRLDTHADYSGAVTVNGQEYWLNCWVNTSKAGAKYMSLKLALKENQPVTTGQYAQDQEVVNNPDDLDDVVPF